MPKKQKKDKEDDEIIQIREDLMSQLIESNKYGKHFESLVEDYIFFEKLKRDTQEDIKNNGLRIKLKTGNGFESEKPNESIKNLTVINSQQLKILQDLGLKSPSDTPKGDDEDDLL